MNVPFPVKVSSVRAQRAIQGSDVIDCIVTKTDGFPDPDYTGDLHTSHQRWFCIEESNGHTMHRLEGDVESLLEGYVQSRHLHLVIPKNMTQRGDQIDSYIDLDSVDASLIKKFDDRNERLNYGNFESERFKGTYKVLIIRVENNSGDTVQQTAKDLYNDFFVDENNLVCRKHF